MNDILKILFRCSYIDVQRKGKYWKTCGPPLQGKLLNVAGPKNNLPKSTIKKKKKVMFF